MALVLAACTGDGTASSSFPAVLDPGEATSLAPASPSDPALVAAAQDKIKHIVFVIKENRTFDNYFGQFPGADGATTGKTCDGGTRPLERAPDRGFAAGHSFTDGITAIDGGKMDCFADVGYFQYGEDQIPNYWAYARRYTLPDRFFSSIYGPTGIEHLWTFAAQSDRFVDHGRPGQMGIGRRQFCDDPLEPDFSFRHPEPRGAATRLRAGGPGRRGRRPDARSTGSNGGPAPTSRCCPTDSRPPASRGRNTAARTSGCSRCG